MEVGEIYEYALTRAPAGNYADVVLLPFVAFADVNVRSWCAASGLLSILIHAVIALNVEVSIVT